MAVTVRSRETTTDMYKNWRGTSFRRQIYP